MHALSNEPSARRSRHRSRALLAAVFTGILALSACSATPSDPSATPAPTATETSSVAPEPTTSSRTVALPPAGAAFDYQLGGAYDPPAGVEIVARDRTADPAPGKYGICYVNAFQTQPGEQAKWPTDVLLRYASGAPLIDPDWPDEVIVDTRQTDRVTAVVLPWIRGCADAGYAAVEFDNLDTYTRTDGVLTRDHNTAVAGILVAAAHKAGLAAGQKNAAQDAAHLRETAGFDFAVTEECAAFDECSAYTDVYGQQVLEIEYPDSLTASFADVCARPGRPASLILRDRALATPDNAGYLYATCP
ncbi:MULTISPECIES: endo alpha-1,4 polygalactosaminidase [unclassified Microbacterium]|uniref:endo alpha-1,4 polygalactosaminidase n=1 Tax=unclassified Microbacterium TaxID=2609290 RepID=UPI0030159467